MRNRHAGILSDVLPYFRSRAEAASQKYELKFLLHTSYVLIYNGTDLKPDHSVQHAGHYNLPVRGIYFCVFSVEHGPSVNYKANDCTPLVNTRNKKYYSTKHALDTTATKFTRQQQQA